MTDDDVRALTEDNRISVRIVWQGLTTQLALDTVGEVTLESVTEVARQCFGIAAGIRGGDDG